MATPALLFDIDGTLLRARGLGTLAYKKALFDVLKQDFDMTNLDWLGQTDGNVITELLLKNNFSKPEIESILPAVFKSYISHFSEIVRDMPDRVYSFAYVRELLDSLEGYCLGLVTGNLLESAYIKLAAVGLDNYFPYGVGGFGSDSFYRPDLVPIALKRMKQHYTQDFTRIVIIGDSHRDVQTARAVGAYAVSVATGHMDKDKLASYHPDILLDNFQDTACFHQFLKNLERA